MPDDLKTALIYLAVAFPLGLIFGIVIRKKRPQWCKDYAKFCLDRKWWLYLFGILIFGAAGLSCYLNGKPYLALIYLAGFVLNLYCMLRYGFRSPTEEQLQKIEQSDPTSFRPFDITKGPPKSNEGAKSD